MLLIANEVLKAITGPASLDTDTGDVDDADGEDAKMVALLLLLLLERLVLLLACLERFSF